MRCTPSSLDDATYSSHARTGLQSDRGRVGGAVLKKLVAALTGDRQRGRIRSWPPSSSAVGETANLQSFSEPDFRARLTDVYNRVGQAWRDKRLSDLEADVTVDVIVAWTAEPPAGPQPMQVAAEALRVRIEEAQAGPAYEHLTVSLDCGGRHAAPQLQFWAFERGHGAAVRGRTCPGCAAPLEFDLHGRCRHCGAAVDLARLAWVLARVESAADWSMRELEPNQDATGALDAVAAADPDFDPDAFLERVATLYPHLLLALRDLSSDLGRVAIDPALRRDLGAMETARRRAGRRAVVESVSVSGVAVWSAGHQGARYAITVDFSGVAVTYELDAAGRLVGGDRSPRSIRDRWTFTRPVGVGSSKHGGVLAEVCPSCGASIAMNESGRCQHCRAEVILGNRDWVLSEVATRPQTYAS
jgi:hypothetical protein